MTTRHLRETLNSKSKVIKRVKNSGLICLLLIFSAFRAYSQCPLILDESGNPVTTATYLLCSKDPRTLFLGFDRSFGPYTINWGDGSPVTNGAGFTVGNVVSHGYPAGVANYTVTITIPGPPNCNIVVTVVKEEPTTASIQVPFGGVTRACAPAILEFVNSSTNNSSNTTYIWNFGDGSANETYNSTNLNQIVPHNYQRGTVNCGTKVTLTAFNYCNIRQGSASVAEYSPILIWDLDKPAISSDTLFCYPDTIVTYTNSTALNCVKPGEGNVEPRTEYWRFIDYFGPGQDSIIDWRPFGPPRTIHYPGLGTYQVELRERSFCGEVNVFRTIRIIEAPIAGIIANKDTICIGENITFTNTSTGPANIHRWNPANGTGWKAFPGLTQTLSYTTAGTYVVKLAVNVNGGSNSCKDTAMVQVVVVPDPIAKFTLSVKKGCDSLRTTITNTSVGGVNWNWTFGQGQTSTLQNPPDQFYASPGVYPIVLTIGSNQGCSSNFKDTVYVYASPNVKISGSNLCIGLPFSPTNTTTFDPLDPITSWAWDFGDVTTSTLKNPTHYYNIDGNFVVSLVAKTANCSGSKNIPIQVYPLPVAAVAPNKSAGCTPLPVQFSNTSTNAVSYSWDFGDGSTSTLSTPGHTFINSSTTTKVFNVRMIAQSVNGCLDTIFTAITVYPAAIANFDYTAVNKCVYLEVDFTNTSSGATSYKWYFGDGDSSIAVNPQHNYTNSGTFVADFTATLIVTSANGCIDSIAKKVSVNPEAKFGFIASPDSGCSPLSVNFTAKTGAASYDWEFPDGTKPSGVFVQKVFVNNGTTELKFKVRLKAQNANGCLDVTEQDIVVFPNPIAAGQLNPTQGCAPLTATLTNNSVGGQTYEWDYGDGNFSFQAAPNHSYVFPNTSAGPLNYKIILTAISAFGCKDTAQLNLKVFPEVHASFDTLAQGCSPLQKTFTGFGGNTYQWNFGNGDIATTNSYTTTFINPGNLTDKNYSIKMIATSLFGCTDTVTGTAIVYPLPLAAFNPDKTQGCPPLLVNLANTTTGGMTYNWNYGDGTGAVNNSPTHAFTFINPDNTSRNYSIQLIAINSKGCRDTTFRSVQVFPDVVARFVHDTIGCDPFPVKFFNTSKGASIYNWSLDSYGSSGLSEPSQVFRNTTSISKTYNIRLIAISADNCSDTAFSKVEVYPKPQAAFGLNTNVGCQPLTVVMTNNSAGATNYQWTYGIGSGSTSASPMQTKVYPNVTSDPIDYELSLIAINGFGCSDTTSKLVTVYPKVQAKFDSIPSGCSPLKITVVDRSIGANFINWDFNGEGASFNSTENFEFTNFSAVDQIKTVTLIAENQYLCRDTLKRNLTVYATPVANFSATPVTQQYPNATVSFSNTTVGSWNYDWNFGVGSNVTGRDPLPKTYSTWGDYLIKLLVSGIHCQDTMSQLISIVPPIPIPDFQGGGVGCKPTTFKFNNTSIYGASFNWDFGDGGVSTQENPTYTYFTPGTYTVELTVTGFGGDKVNKIKVGVVTVNDNAEAYFTFTPETTATNDKPIDFLNLSSKADYYHWDFGDGTTSNEKNPSHTYTKQGVFDIFLIADNRFNCPDTFYVRNGVTIIDGGHIELPTAFTPNPSGSSGGVYDPNSLDNDVFFPFNKDVDVYQLEVFSRWGEKIFHSNDVNIGWDGYFNGKLCQQDVYVYKVTAIFKGGEKFEKVGDVTLLR